MAYIDTTLTPEGGYTYVNYRQVYDVIATELTSHAAWDFVETVDYTTSGQTHRSHVWKCLSSVSGLSADFFVVFTIQFTVTGTVYQTSAGIGVQVAMGEAYNSTTHVLTKYAPHAVNSSVTLGADRSSPGSWTLNTQLKNAVATPSPFYSAAGVAGAQTSYRMFVLTTNDALLVFSGTSVSGLQVYAGAIDSTMDGTDDPLPLILGGASANSLMSGGTSWATWSSTRHPKLTPSTAYNWVFQYAPHSASYYTSNNNPLQTFSGVAEFPSTNGTLGSVADVGYSLFTGIVPVGRIPMVTCALTASPGTSASTRGGRRGYLKYGLTAQVVAAHSAGDTFLVDGDIYVGMGSTANGLWDTTAA